MDFNKTCMDHVYYQWKIHVVDNWIDHMHIPYLILRLYALYRSYFPYDRCKSNGKDK
jgi:hypothetical protein